MAFQLTEREHRWLTVLLILATVAAAFVVVGYVAGLLLFFGDVIFIFFLAWLLAFIISPIASFLVRLIPRLPHAAAVIIVYAGLLVVLFLVALLLAQQLYTSVQTLVQNFPGADKVTQLLQPWQDRLNQTFGLNIDLTGQAPAIVENVKNFAFDLVQPNGPLYNLAIASIGIVGNLLFVFFLSLYMALDRERILRFLFRLVPPSYSDEAALFESSISRSFGGFLRGQALMGLVYAAIAAVTSLVLGLPYLPVTASTSGILQAIPFFGPFVSWAPPVLAAIFFAPDAVVPTFVIMLIGWFVVMNVIQPRLMADAVGLHPIVVLGSVLIGSKLAGVPGAVFGIPIAAVISAFFFYYLGQHGTSATVAARAAHVVEAREGRRVHMPREPQPGEDEDVPESALQAEPARRRRGASTTTPIITQAHPADPAANPASDR